MRHMVSKGCSDERVHLSIITDYNAMHLLRNIFSLICVIIVDIDSISSQSLRISVQHVLLRYYNYETRIDIEIRSHTHNI